MAKRVMISHKRNTDYNQQSETCWGAQVETVRVKPKLSESNQRYSLSATIGRFCSTVGVSSSLTVGRSSSRIWASSVTASPQYRMGHSGGGSKWYTMKFPQFLIWIIFHSLQHSPSR